MNLQKLLSHRIGLFVSLLIQENRRETFQRRCVVLIAREQLAEPALRLRVPPEVIQAPAEVVLGLPAVASRGKNREGRAGVLDGFGEIPQFLTICPASHHKEFSAIRTAWGP